jgi:enoyl-[acyl-carrier-protein] reductase (NADH)
MLASMADDDAGRDKLTRALARTVAHRKQLTEARERLRAHATERLDGHVHAIGVANEALNGEHRDNSLVYRYLRSQLTEAARLRAIEGRGKPDASGE